MLCINKTWRIHQGCLAVSGADVHTSSRDGKTPLMYAAWFIKDVDVVKLLLSAGVDLEARSKWGMTPLMYAAKNKNPEIVPALLKAGANAKAKDNKGRTALDYIKLNEALKDSKAKWMLNDAMYK